MSESTSRVSHWADEHRPGLPGRLDGEAVPVDQADAGGQRVHAEAGPGQIEERQSRHDLDARPAPSARSSSTVRSATSGEPGTA